MGLNIGVIGLIAIGAIEGHNEKKKALQLSVERERLVLSHVLAMSDAEIEGYVVERETNRVINRNLREQGYVVVKKLEMEELVELLKGLCERFSVERLTAKGIRDEVMGCLREEGEMRDRLVDMLVAAGGREEGAKERGDGKEVEVEASLETSSETAVLI